MKASVPFFADRHLGEAKTRRIIEVYQSISHSKLPSIFYKFPLKLPPQLPTHQPGKCTNSIFIFTNQESKCCNSTSQNNNQFRLATNSKKKNRSKKCIKYPKSSRRSFKKFTKTQPFVTLLMFQV
ncbi:unnamed protein product [Citrullus colocynthis]|uniref:Uncharacterized protein n=1 Tax=Citrullus colocynthis TaxID=252529 RepID=A0ABP0XSF5_9ROSI